MAESSGKVSGSGAGNTDASEAAWEFEAKEEVYLG